MITVKLSEERSEGFVRRIAKSQDKEVWWDIEGSNDVLPPPLDLHDMAASCFIFYAMSKGEDLYIAGPVSHSLLENLEDLVASWVNYCPHLYKTIRIFAEEEVTDKSRTFPPQAKNKAIAAFSGGLDATFTAWRHHNHKVGRRSRKILAGALIQGFDIPLDKMDAFEISAISASNTLQSIGLPLVTVQTNWKNQVCENWEMEFGDGVATCLMNWQGAVETALIGSDMDFRRLVFPWGGSPMTYGMLSSEGFNVVYDGGEFARTEKTKGISDWEEGLKNLRVCWAGPLTGKNCGVCEKCIRTKMNFLAMGVPLPPSLPGTPSFFSVSCLRTSNEQQVALLNDIVETAKQRNIEDPWLQALRFAIFKNKLIHRFALVRYMRNGWRYIKSFVKSLQQVPDKKPKLVLEKKFKPSAKTTS
ncbi:MAG TPA: hypothetical protein VK949_06035 [Methylotenera sp.]|nr:hypothetical protein [Methylotenera sp.]